MATDPQTLLSQANCYACFAEGSTTDLMVLALLAQWVANATLVNLIPSNATYDGTSHYTFTITVGKNYEVILGTSEITASNGAQNFIPPPASFAFTATNASLIFTGLSVGFPVTAKLYLLN